MKPNIGMKCIAFTGEEIELRSALVSGITGNDETPMSFYSGMLDLEEIHSAIFYANRAIIKILLDEFRVGLGGAEELLISAVTEAITKEYNIQAGSCADDDVKKKVRILRDNQN